MLPLFAQSEGVVDRLTCGLLQLKDILAADTRRQFDLSSNAAVITADKGGP